MKRTMTYRPRAQASFNGGKIPLDRFAPRARAFHWGGRATPLRSRPTRNFARLALFFNIYLTAVVRNACSFT